MRKGNRQRLRTRLLLPLTCAHKCHSRPYFVCPWGYHSWPQVSLTPYKYHERRDWWWWAPSSCPDKTWVVRGGAQLFLASILAILLLSATFSPLPLLNLTLSSYLPLTLTHPPPYLFSTAICCLMVDSPVNSATACPSQNILSAKSCADLRVWMISCAHG